PAGTSPRKAGKSELGTGKLDAKLVNGKMKITYGVREGDSLWSICQEYACTVDQLRGWNNLPKRTGALKVGTVLAIWQEEKKAPSASGGSGPVMAVKATVLAQASKRTHQLASGETLWSVAQRYGVSVDDLMKWNGISNHRNLKAGQSLVVSR
ncbi:MAG TPA: LysM peptidoglycan-binding domain-containing protein, partial [Myxococcaceae bacterium]|nr:LysM peptidoglycan-binding domain-containing protein [Myxococcaceae bacterium]